jgi:dihydrofolate reductase
VFSMTLTKASTAKTRIEKTFDPEAIRKLKEQSSRDISVGGAELAGQAITAGLVDEIQLFLHPIVVGSGRRALPDNALVRLELLDERRFKSGVVYVHYRTRR